MSRHLQQIRQRGMAVFGRTSHCQSPLDTREHWQANFCQLVGYWWQTEREGATLQSLFVGSQQDQSGDSLPQCTPNGESGGFRCKGHEGGGGAKVDCD